MLVRLEQVFASPGRRTGEDKRTGIRLLMGEARPKEGHRVVALEAVRTSSHDLLSRHVVAAVDEYRWAEAEALDIHDAACSPQGEDSMKARGG